MKTVNREYTESDADIRVLQHSECQLTLVFPNNTYVYICMYSACMCVYICMEYICMYMYSVYIWDIYVECTCILTLTLTLGLTQTTAAS